jgi:hypothetical protein
MNELSALSSALSIRWDAPYRILGSVLALSAVAGLATGRTTLEALAAVSHWANWAGGTIGLTVGHDWVGERGEAIRWVGISLVVMGVAFAHYRSRGGATAMVGAAICAECSDSTGLWIFTFVVVLWILAGILMLFDIDFVTEIYEFASSRIAELLTALFFLVAVPLGWALRRE